MQQLIPAGQTLKLNFPAIAKSLDETVTVPPGYTVKVLFRLGDPLHASVPECQNEGSENAESFLQRAAISTTA